MATWGPRLVTSTSAATVAALAGAKHDLETAEAFCKLLAAVDLRSADGSALGDGLSVAVAIRYCRCFTTGVRRKHTGDVLQTMVDALPDHLREAHIFLTTVRDKHVAHSVNALEENHVTVHVREAPDLPALGGIGTLQARTMALSPDSAPVVIELCRAIGAALDTVIDEQKAALTAEIAALPLEQVYTFPEPGAFAPDWTRIHLPRK